MFFLRVLELYLDIVAVKTTCRLASQQIKPTVSLNLLSRSLRRIDTGYYQAVDALFTLDFLQPLEGIAVNLSMTRF